MKSSSFKNQVPGVFDPLDVQRLTYWPEFISLSGCDLLKDTGCSSCCLLEDVHLFTLSFGQFLCKIPKHLDICTFESGTQRKNLLTILRELATPFCFLSFSLIDELGFGQNLPHDSLAVYLERSKHFLDIF